LRVPRPIYLDISGIEQQLAPDKVDEAIRLAAGPLLEARSRFEVVAFTAKGEFSTRRNLALRAFGANVRRISLDEHVGRISSHDKVKLLVVGEPAGTLLQSLSDMFVDIEIIVPDRPVSESIDAVPELQ
jgi:hypothetical protein